MIRIERLIKGEPSRNKGDILVTRVKKDKERERTVKIRVRRNVKGRILRVKINKGVEGKRR